MKESNTKTKRARDTMRAEYDFSGGVRGKYARAYRQETNVIVLDPDVARRFKTSKAVNDALRAVLRAQK
jgi:hypothetical protein